MAAPITASTVRHIAMLGRLKLTDEEVAGFAPQLSAILEYVDQLKQVDVEGVEPTAHAVDIRNVLRADEVLPSIGIDKALSNAPRRKDSYFVAPKVLDQETV
jgi:aspartyl-tRNA(Asn)/glutamyl-tRNA(Gln) amidotransferase subunit C